MPRIVREERTQETYNPYLGDVTEAAQKKKQKRKHFCHKNPDMLITEV